MASSFATALSAASTVQTSKADSAGSASLVKDLKKELELLKIQKPIESFILILVAKGFITKENPLYVAVHQAYFDVFLADVEIKDILLSANPAEMEAFLISDFTDYMATKKDIAPKLEELVGAIRKKIKESHLSRSYYQTLEASHSADNLLNAARYRARIKSSDAKTQAQVDQQIIHCVEKASKLEKEQKTPGRATILYAGYLVKEKKEAKQVAVDVDLVIQRLAKTQQVDEKKVLGEAYLLKATLESDLNKSMPHWIASANCGNYQAALELEHIFYRSMFVYDQKVDPKFPYVQQIEPINLDLKAEVVQVYVGSQCRKDFLRVMEDYEQSGPVFSASYALHKVLYNDKDEMKRVTEAMLNPEKMRIMGRENKELIEGLFVKAQRAGSPLMISDNLIQLLWGYIKQQASTETPDAKNTSGFPIINVGDATQALRELMMFAKMGYNRAAKFLQFLTDNIDKELPAHPEKITYMNNRRDFLALLQTFKLEILDVDAEHGEFFIKIHSGETSALEYLKWSCNALQHQAKVIQSLPSAQPATGLTSSRFFASNSQLSSPAQAAKLSASSKQQDVKKQDSKDDFFEPLLANIATVLSKTDGVLDAKQTDTLNSIASQPALYKNFIKKCLERNYVYGLVNRGILKLSEVIPVLVNKDVFSLCQQTILAFTQDALCSLSVSKLQFVQQMLSQFNEDQKIKLLSMFCKNDLLAPVMNQGLISWGALCVEDAEPLVSFLVEDQGRAMKELAMINREFLQQIISTLNKHFTAMLQGVGMQQVMEQSASAAAPSVSMGMAKK